MPNYEVKESNLGAIVTGIDLKADVSDDVIKQIKSDVTKHRILIFKNQGVVSGKRHVEISQWFGELDSTFYKHPKSPHPDVFRVSNDADEGCTGVGRTGWHIDGSFQPAPFSHSLYHMVSIPSDGNTVFAPLTKLIENLPKEKRQQWERLWCVSDRRANIIHPLIYSHPLSGKPVLCFHLGMTEAFIWDADSDKARVSRGAESKDIFKDILHEFVKNNGEIQYSHKWEEGDFIISDNLAVGHEASPSTQYPRSQVGLRVLHRTTVKGIRHPAKENTYTYDMS